MTDPRHDPHPAHDDPPEPEAEPEGFTVEHWHERHQVTIEVHHPLAPGKILRVLIREGVHQFSILARTGRTAGGSWEAYHSRVDP